MPKINTLLNQVLPFTITEKWQNLIDLIGATFDLPATLIMKVEGEYIEVFAKSEVCGNSYIIGKCEKINGHYSEVVINSCKKLLIPNALKDKEWMNNPDIKKGMISYLGFPICMPDEKVFGTLCVLDKQENAFNRDIEELLLQIKEIIELDIAGFLAFEGKSIRLEERVREQLQVVNDKKQAYKDIKTEWKQELCSQNKLKSCASKVDHKLLQREQKYSTLVNKMESAVVILSPIYGANGQLIDAVYIDANPMTKKLTGYKREEVLGKSVLEVFPETDTSWFATFEPVLKENKKVNFDLFFPPLSKHFSVNAFPMGDGSFCVNYFDISGQVFLKERIEESELRYKSFYNSIEAGIVIFDPMYNSKGELEDLRYVDMNPVNEQIVKVKSKDLIGQTHSEAFPDTHDEFLAHFKSVIANRRGTRFEKYYPLSSKYYSTNIFPIDNGLIAFTCYDITESVLAKQKIEASEKRHKALLENSSSLMVLIDPETGAILEVNKAVLDYTGYSKEEFQAMDLNLISTSGKEVIQEQLRLARDENKNYYELKHRLASGEIRDIEVYTGNIEENGKTFLHCIVHDVTDKKNAIKEILKLSKAVEQSPVSIVITDARGTIEYTNPKNCEMTGYGAEDLIGKNPRILKSGKHSKRSYQELWKTIVAGGKWEGEFYNRKKDGSFYWEYASIAPILNEEGEAINFIKIGKDVTERKNITKELRKAKFQAEESDRLKTAFLANLSHEIRTPLNGILGFSQLIVSEEIPDEEKRDYETVIQESGEQLMMIINDLVKISQIEAGGMSIKPTEFLVAHMLDEMVKFHQPECKARHLELHQVTDRCITNKCISDRQRIRQVLDHLMKNAIKFTKQGEIRVTAECSETHLLLSVKDTGIGIASKYHDLIFDRFRQVEDHYTRNYGGTGLGLSISKEIVELLGGEIWVESQLGEGATFRFTIPLEKGAAL